MAKTCIITGIDLPGNIMLAAWLSKGIGGFAMVVPDIEKSKNPDADIQRALEFAGNGTVIFTMVKYMKVFNSYPHTHIVLSQWEN